MTGLREELERLAEQAPAVHVPGDTWARARAAERRARAARAATAAVAAAAVVALVALVAGLVAVQPDPQPARPGDDGLAVPDRVWAVPERLAAQREDGSWASGQVSADLAVGTGAVAFVAAGGLPVVVEAAEGEYHLLDLPGWLGEDALVRTASSGLDLALSPDGRRLAFGYADLGPESVDEPVPSGVRVVDLTTGEVAEWPVVGEEGTLVEQVAWSPDGRWLAWAGERAGSWTPGSFGSAAPVLGRLRLDRPGAVEEAPPALRRGGDAAVGIGDDGVVLAAVGDTLRRWDGGSTTRLRPGDAAPVVSLSIAPGGDQVAVGAVGGEELRLVDLRDGSDRAVDEGLPGETAWAVRPLGWVGEEVLAGWVSPAGDESGLSLVGAGTPRRVAEVDGAALETLSVAVDLVDPARPTVSRPEPDFGWAPEQVGWAAAAALLVVGLLALGVGHVRRRRRWSSSER